MTTLYSCKSEIDHAGADRWRITKFTDGEVESSYLTDDQVCECPAGVRPTCRHRQMLPQMRAHGIVNTHWFYEFETQRIVDFEGVPKSRYDALIATNSPTVEAEGPLAELARIPGVQVVSLNDPAALFNTIADAVGEPHLKVASQPEGKSSWRRM